MHGAASLSQLQFEGGGDIRKSQVCSCCWHVYVNLGYFGSETVSILFLKRLRGNSKQVKEDSTDVNNSCVSDNKDLNAIVFGKA